MTEYLRVTEPDGSEWVNAEAFDEAVAALKGLVALVRTPDNFAMPEIRKGRAVIAKVMEQS